jgi:hypothetical protein
MGDSAGNLSVGRRRLLGLAPAALAMGALTAARIPAVAAQTGLPSWVPAPGHRANISLNTLRDVDPCPSRNCGYSGNEGQSGVLADWNGGAFAPDYSRLGAYLVNGGGHGGYYGNEVYAFDLDTRRWERLSEPYEPSPGARGWIARDAPLGPTGSREEGEYAPGVPASCHNYDTIQYLPAALAGNRRGAFVRLNGIACGLLDSQFSGRAHAFDLDRRRWARFSTNLTTPADGGRGASATCLDTRRARFWAVGNGHYAATRFLDIKTRTWSSVRHDPRRAHNFTFNISGAYHEGLDLFVVIHYPISGKDPDRSSLWAMDCGRTEEGWHRIATEGPRPLGRGPGLEWCPPLSCFVAYEGRGVSRVMKLRPPESAPFSRPWTWEAEEIGGEAPVGRKSGAPHYSRFCWAPAVRCFIWADAHDQPVQTWRLRGT